MSALKGKIKWFNQKKATDLLKEMIKKKMYLYMHQQLKQLV